MIQMIDEAINRMADRLDDLAQKLAGLADETEADRCGILETELEVLAIRNQLRSVTKNGGE